MDESFVIAKCAATDQVLGDSSKSEAKRSNQWLVDSGEPQLYSSKKQAIHPPSSQLVSGISPSSVTHWEGVTSFQSIQSQYLDKLCGPEHMHSVDFDERKGEILGDDHDISVGLSISQCGENPETCLSFNGMKRLKVDRVRDSDGGICIQKTSPLDRDNSSNYPGGLANNRPVDTAFVSMGPNWNNNIRIPTLMRRDYEEQIQIRSVDSTYDNGSANVVSVMDSYKGDVNVLSFGGYNGEEGPVIPVGRPICGVDESYSQSCQTKNSDGGNQLDTPVINSTRVVKPRSDSASKNKLESKPSKKEAPNSFPNNVRSLISTGMLDGVPVKYILLSREELRGVIKGSGYLCGCQSCHFTKVLNAFEFERHAGCKTKHPNNHIYFENGKTIYQIVQELRSTPQDMLFDAIQTVFGAPVNQKSFRIWKESYLAATRELQRIYGKDINT